MIEAVVTQSEKDNQWYGEFKGGNHETWWVSEGYPEDDIAVNSVIDFIAAIYETAPVEIPHPRHAATIINIKVVDKNGTILRGG
jgi:uncharacterized protein YegP (UPF0339 family)